MPDKNCNNCVFGQDEYHKTTDICDECSEYEEEDNEAPLNWKPIELSNTKNDKIQFKKEIMNKKIQVLIDQKVKDIKIKENILEITFYNESKIMLGITNDHNLQMQAILIETFAC